MALMDRAVNGMISRLLPVGFMPWEALCLAQAAYLKESKRHPEVPRPILERQQVSAAVNQAVSLLERNSFGPDAHRERIILWESVFGRGTWHEPIPPEEIYGETSPQGGSEPDPIEDLRQAWKEANFLPAVSKHSEIPSPGPGNDTNPKSQPDAGFSPEMVQKAVRDLEEALNHDLEEGQPVYEIAYDGYLEDFEAYPEDQHSSPVTEVTVMHHGRHNEVSQEARDLLVARCTAAVLEELHMEGLRPDEDSIEVTCANLQTASDIFVAESGFSREWNMLVCKVRIRADRVD
jgi:hypothetical protein